LRRKPDRRDKYLGDIVCGRTRSDSAELHGGLRSHPLIHAQDARIFFGNADDIIVLCRYTDVFKFGCVELDSGFSEKLLQEKAADKVTDG
jgi:hypothetical protein